MSDFRGLTLTQPWASAVVLGAKRNETRSWSTKYRGAVAIHAAKDFPSHELLSQSCSWTWIGALWQTGVGFGNGPTFEDVLPFGAIIGVAEIADCRPTDSFTQGELDQERTPENRGEFAHLYKWTERQMGDYSSGRFAFALARVRMLAEPIPCRGALGLWRVPEPIIDEIACDLAGGRATPAGRADGGGE